ncbi:MAG TPA: SAM-dependent methyltransferase [Pyrinomonadaceae bacterium]|nr:SAM-dependent methyltransferase [Pyrinomonadaceae bacterium]
MKEKLQARIREVGPITFREWMNAALYDFEHGYYCAPDRVRWGRDGDYRTSPERTELFANTCARYAQELYRDLGEPPVWTFLEAGAGSGDFALGFLGRLQQLDQSCFQTCRYVIDEKSEALRASIGKRQGQLLDRIEFSVIETRDTFEGIVFANELLDAFPVHRVTWRDERLLEYFVTVDDNGAFEWQLGEASTDNLHGYFQRLGLKPRDQQIVEVNLGIQDWFAAVREKLSRGFQIVIDYGAKGDELLHSPLRQSGTLRAIRRHQLVPDVFADPGEQDLTTTIDWTYVQRLAVDYGFRVKEFLSQDKFLLKSGFLEELESRLLHAESEAEKQQISGEAREMILPTGMAAAFQVLVLAKDI